MNGNGWVGPTASGVRIGATRASNHASAHFRSAVDSSDQSTTTTPIRGERRQELVGEQALRGLDQRPDPLADLRPPHARGEPLRRAGVHTFGDLLLDAADADHEELVEVRVEDRQEPQPLEQRVLRVLGLFEHAGVEREPRQLAIEIPVRGLREGGRFGWDGAGLGGHRGILAAGCYGPAACGSC
jgi:hypothetical protein